MEECEICGAKVNDIYVVDVEDVELRVCTKCAKGKKIVSKVVKNRGTPNLRERKIEDPQLVENYGAAIHNAREAMKIPLKVLAEMLNEKDTLLLRIEQEKTLPSLELTKKIEKALGIKLTEPEKQGENVVLNRNRDGATLGDFAEKR
jgi:putative transcription factor